MPTTSRTPRSSASAKLFSSPEGNDMPPAPKSRLGRGLGGLIAAGKPAAAPAAHAAAAPAAPAPSAGVPAGIPGYQEVAVAAIEPSPYQARREIPADQLNELAESI